MQIPAGFPSINFPEGNEFSFPRWNLGKRLFFDPILSKSGKTSCASCHLPAFAFSDTTVFSAGDMQALGRSNSPSLTNIGYHPYFTRAGGVPTLEMQVLVPIQEHDEFNTNILDIAERLNADDSYIRQSMDAYNRKPDPFVITRALANFERSLISGNSRFDQFMQGNKKHLFSESERRGYELFFSAKTDCSSCHSGFNFTDYTFKNNGLYEVYADSGRMRLTRLESDRALFKVPGLRNIGVTGPYMHDGSFATLEQVIDHYDSGGKNHPNKSPLIRPLKLSPTEKNDLLAFLQTLTDHTFLQNPNFKR